MPCSRYRGSEVCSITANLATAQDGGILVRKGRTKTTSQDTPESDVITHVGCPLTKRTANVHATGKRPTPKVEELGCCPLCWTLYYFSLMPEKLVLQSGYPASVWFPTSFGHRRDYVAIAPSYVICRYVRFHCELSSCEPYTRTQVASSAPSNRTSGPSGCRGIINAFNSRWVCLLFA